MTLYNKSKHHDKNEAWQGIMAILLKPEAVLGEPQNL